MVIFALTSQFIAQTLTFISPMWRALEAIRCNIAWELFTTQHDTAQQNTAQHESNANGTWSSMNQCGWTLLCSTAGALTLYLTVLSKGAYQLPSARPSDPALLGMCSSPAQIHLRPQPSSWAPWGMVISKQMNLMLMRSACCSPAAAVLTEQAESVQSSLPLTRSLKKKRENERKSCNTESNSLLCQTSRIKKKRKALESFTSAFRKNAFNIFFQSPICFTPSPFFNLPK